MSDLGVLVQGPITIHCNNESSIRLARNPIYHAKTKHISVHYHFAREKLESGEMIV